MTRAIPVLQSNASDKVFVCYQQAAQMWCAPPAFFVYMSHLRRITCYLYFRQTYSMSQEQHVFSHVIPQSSQLCNYMVLEEQKLRLRTHGCVYKYIYIYKSDERVVCIIQIIHIYIYIIYVYKSHTPAREKSVHFERGSLFIEKCL